VPILLIGLKSDLRDNPQTLEELVKTGEVPVSAAEGEAMAKEIGAVAYMECSATANEGIVSVRDQAIAAVLESRERARPKVESRVSLPQSSRYVTQ
jgi:GTPase SAR1 family protein